MKHGLKKKLSRTNDKTNFGITSHEKNMASLIIRGATTKNIMN